MAKWLVLAAGVFLFFNGTMSRTYGFSNPEKHCFNMDYIYLAGCFGNSTIPSLIVWGATLAGAALIVWSLLRSRRAA